MAPSFPPPRRTFDDTPRDIEQRVIDGYRSMSAAEKMACVVSLNRALETLARAGIRDRHGPDLSEREIRLRLGALRLSRETMVQVFDWDPAEHGYQGARLDHAYLRVAAAALGVEDLGASAGRRKGLGLSLAQHCQTTQSVFS